MTTTSTEIALRFDYASLPGGVATDVANRTREIKTRTRRAAEDIVRIGEELVAVKAALGHGRFGEWLHVEFAWSERTAQNMMRVAERFKSATVADLEFAPTALYLLSADDVPEPARAEAVAEAKAGRPVTPTVAKRIVAAHKPGPTDDEMRAEVDSAIAECEELGSSAMGDAIRRELKRRSLGSVLDYVREQMPAVRRWAKEAKRKKAEGQTTTPPSTAAEPQWAELPGEAEPVLSPADWDEAEAEGKRTAAAEAVRKLIAKTTREVDAFADLARLKGAAAHGQTIDGLGEVLDRFGRLAAAANREPEPPATSPFKLNNERARSIARKSHERFCLLMGNATTIVEAVEVINLDAAMAVLNREWAEGYIEDAQRAIATLRYLSARMREQLGRTAEGCPDDEPAQPVRKIESKSDSVVAESKAGVKSLVGAVADLKNRIGAFAATKAGTFVNTTLLNRLFKETREELNRAALGQPCRKCEGCGCLLCEDVGYVTKGHYE